MMLLNPISVLSHVDVDATQRNTIVAALPMCHPASLDADSGVGAFPVVGGGQALIKRLRDVQCIRGKTLFQSFHQTGCGRETAVAEPI